MATSSSTNFSTSRDDLTKYALLNVGGIGQGETPSATQYTDGAVLLNMLVKQFQADGMPLWALKQTSFSFTASTNSYTVGTSATIATARPLKIISAFTRDTNADPDTDLPMEIITRQEYERLSSKASTGTPIKLWYDPRGGATATGILYVWPTPDSTAVSYRTCYITHQRPFEDFDAAGDEPDFPQEWYMPLLWMLSWALAPSYGVPLEERKLLLAEATKLKNEVLNFGMEEGSLYLEPEQEM